MVLFVVLSLMALSFELSLMVLISVLSLMVLIFVLSLMVMIFDLSLMVLIFDLSLTVLIFVCSEAHASDAEFCLILVTVSDRVLSHSCGALSAHSIRVHIVSLVHHCGRSIRTSRQQRSLLACQTSFRAGSGHVVPALPCLRCRWSPSHTLWDVAAHVVHVSQQLYHHAAHGLHISASPLVFLMWPLSFCKRVGLVRRSHVGSGHR